MKDFVKILKDRDRLCRFCRLLDYEVVQYEFNHYLDGYTLKHYDRVGRTSSVYFVKDNSRVHVTLSLSEITMSRREDNIFERISISEDLSLDQIKIEKRENGELITNVEKLFGKSLKFDNKIVLTDLRETRYVIENSKLMDIFSDVPFEDVSLINVYMKFRYLSLVNKLDSVVSLKNVFSTQMNSIYNDFRHFFRKMPNNICSSITFFNDKDVSNIYDMINDSPDKLYRVYDLYKGIINERNIGDIKSIHNGILSSKSFDILESSGVRLKEDFILGKDLLLDNISSRNYLIGRLLNDLALIEGRYDELQEDFIDNSEILDSNVKSKSLIKRIISSIKK